MPSGSKRKRHKISTHKRKKRLRKNRHKKKINFFFSSLILYNKKSGLASELIVRNNKDNIDVALLKNGRLVELHKIQPENSFSIGDIYLGVVRKTSLNSILHL